MADIPLVQLPYPEEETRTFELSTSLSPNWDKNGRIYYTDETGQVVRPQTKYNPLQMLGRRLKAFGSNAKNFVEDFNMDKSHTYFAPFEDINEQYKAGNIDKSELPYLAQGRAEQEIRDAQQQERDNINRGWLGTGLSAASMHPIFNIPYVGTGLGGAMYDLGQGITEGDNADELWDRTKRGFAIGETVGAIPYVGKLAGKTKAGQAVGSTLNKAGEKFANTKLYDALMTDIKGFNPNKQTGYHGSPYDFNKFSNEAIGTGEGAQAHGLGHYTALDKNIADNRYRKRQLRTVEEREIDSKYKPLFDNEQKIFNAKSQELYNLRFKDNKLSEEEYQKGIDEASKKTYKILDEWHNAINNIDKTKATKETGQLYKLSVPKDDVMLREGATFENQPELVQKGLNNIKKDYLKSKGYNSIDDINAELDSLSNQYENIVKNESPYNFNAGIKKSEIQARISQLENLRRFNETPDLYNYLLNHQHLEPHEVSDLLYKQGIKGISYNGGIDGEARVIFNPDDIVIGRKYYNQPNLYQQLTGKQNTGALVDALFNR